MPWRRWLPVRGQRCGDQFRWRSWEANRREIQARRDPEERYLAPYLRLAERKTGRNREGLNVRQFPEAGSGDEVQVQSRARLESSSSLLQCRSRARWHWWQKLFAVEVCLRALRQVAHATPVPRAESLLLESQARRCRQKA